MSRFLFIPLMLIAAFYSSVKLANLVEPILRPGNCVNSDRLNSDRLNSDRLNSDRLTLGTLNSGSLTPGSLTPSSLNSGIFTPGSCHNHVLTPGTNKQVVSITGNYRLARLKYEGGGDWYGDRTALGNLALFCNEQLKTDFNPEEAVVEPGSQELFQYPYVFVTGHGNILLNGQEADNMRRYLIAGGFLHISDNYGFNKFVRTEMKKVFPELEFVELPYSYPVFHQKFNFAGGLPKIHEHDGKRAQAFGLIYKGRLVCFFDYECDLGNGWEDVGTYPDDPPAKHRQALEMGANLISYVFMQ